VKKRTAGLDAGTDVDFMWTVWQRAISTVLCPDNCMSTGHPTKSAIRLGPPRHHRKTARRLSTDWHPDYAEKFKGISQNLRSFSKSADWRCAETAKYSGFR